MPQHISIEEGVLYPQPDYTISVDRNGKWTTAQVFLCHRESIVKLMLRPMSEHPDVSFLKMDTASAKVSEGGISHRIGAIRNHAQHALKNAERGGITINGITLAASEHDRSLFAQGLILCMRPKFVPIFVGS